MTTVLQYLVIAGVIGLVVFGLAVVVFGRGEQLAPLSPRTSPTELPDRGMTAQDIRSVRFAMAVRGYRMNDVDWALERLSDEVDRLRAEIAGLRSAGVTPADGDQPESEPDGAGLHPPASASSEQDSVPEEGPPPVNRIDQPTDTPPPGGASTGARAQADRAWGSSNQYTGQARR